MRAVSRPVSKVTKHTGVYWVSWSGLLVTAVQLEPCALGQLTPLGYLTIHFTEEAV
jgi:hypothetical protein